VAYSQSEPQGTFNNVLERDVDRHMDRTADRPVVQGQISPRRATAFGLLLAAASVGVFVVFVNALAAALGLLAILFYSVVYTLVLKPHTTQNIVIGGGVVGAFPALIGWAAVENTVGMPAIILGTVIFLWTPAHFYNLALAYREDYAAAGFPMLPRRPGGNNDSTAHPSVPRGDATRGGRTRRHNPTRLAVCRHYRPGRRGVFLWATVRLFRERTEQAAFRTFHASNAYLGGLLIAILVDTLLV